VLLALSPLLLSDELLISSLTKSNNQYFKISTLNKISLILIMRCNKEKLIKFNNNCGEEECNNKNKEKM
jgi:hypothetical protein